MIPTEKRNRLRAILNGNETISPATVFDALSARVAEAAGYTCGILSGSVSAATVLGVPDMALQTLSEFAHQVRTITRASDLSVFVDADQGYGNALNVMRTVEELEHAGLAGLAIEDLVMPSRFGVHGTLELISTAEMLGKLKAALAARRDPSLVIVARTAALRVEPIENVVARVREYVTSGVDGIFLSGLKTLDQLDAVRAAVKLPIILGSVPGMKRTDLSARGVRFHLQGHAVLAACAKAMHDTYTHLLAANGQDGLQPNLATPETMARLLKVADYDQWDKTYLNS
jgi:carboxyvinyl-carboxyphosphonate phosphorylmutase